MHKLIDHNHEADGIDRRGFLDCMLWAGSAMLYSFSGGVARSQTIHPAGHMKTGGFHFVQISDSHIGFKKEANPDVAGTLRRAVEKINALAEPPAFLIHTGDITHLSKPEEFDTAEQILHSAKVGKVLYVPGEHDVLTDNGKQYLDRFGKGSKGSGWFSFDMQGVHFIGLVNVLDLKAGGLGALGEEQLAWLAADVKPLSSSTPVVVFAHVPLWTVYADWGWGTEDGMRALDLLRRFGSVSVLNGHIHQTLQKVEGNMTFHTAASTAFPQPQPGMAASPGPMKVPAEKLASMLGLTEVRYTQGSRALAVIDSTLEDSGVTVKIDNFRFAPAELRVAAGARISWTNHDDIPHNVVAANKAFASPVLDTGETFSQTFPAPGEYEYYCSLHPKMTGKLIVGDSRAA